MSSASQRLAASLADRYSLERELGAGGMATVYLAADLRHDRKVALKVLRPELAAVIGADRFLQEIRLTANLQHPHILPLFDSGTVDGTVFYVMPYVEGESLRDRLDREKQLPVADGLRIATEVAHALDYAHRRGVIHRDIKPENILLHDGSVVVADFGVALAAGKGASDRLTETGMSLGTPHYMSPEQAMGERDIDARSDVYALGATLYEMMAGEPPFTGPNAQAIVARVLSEVPRPLTSTRPMVPANVDDAVRTALQKLPADRFQTAGAFADALARPGAAVASAVPVHASRAARLAPWLVATAAVVVAVIAVTRGERAPDGPPPSRLAILAPMLRGYSGGGSLSRQVALTPDGGAVIFAATDEAGVNRLFRQRLDAEDAVVLPYTGPFSDLTNPVVSHDGRVLLATADAEGRLFRFPIDGGSGTQLAAASRVNARQSGYHAFDERGDIWVTSLSSMASIVRVGAGDSIVQELGPYPVGARVQQVLPGGHVLVNARAYGTSAGPLSVLNPATGAETKLYDSPVVEARYTAGYLVVALGTGDLQAMPFDVRAQAVTGTPVTIATGVSLTGNGLAQFDVAPNGTVAYIPEEPRSLVFVDRAGTSREATRDRRNFHAPVFSPDGKRVSTDFVTSDGRDVWLVDVTDGTMTRTTFVRDGHDAGWTPDGRFLTYSSTMGGVLGLYRSRPGSAAAADSLFAWSGLTWSGQWLGDGSAVVTVANELRPGSGSDVALIRNQGRGPLEPLIATPFDEYYPAVSPDQRWLAFGSDQSGQNEIYVRPLGSDGDVVQVSQQGGTEPVWRRDSRALFYRGFTAEGQPMLFAAGISGNDAPTVTGRQPLFSLADYVNGQPHPNYDVSPDGRTFVMVRRSTSTRIMVIQNLPALVERLRIGEGASR